MLGQALAQRLDHGSLRRRIPDHQPDAREAGLRHVYTGNVHDRQGGTTFCPQCDAALIERDWHRIVRYELTDDARCPRCATAIPGRFAPYRGSFGNRRIPLRVHAR